MVTKFIASQSVEISVPQQSIPIQHYLRQPQRLVNALADNTRIQQLSEEVFRLKMRPLSLFDELSVLATGRGRRLLPVPEMQPARQPII